MMELIGMAISLPAEWWAGAIAWARYFNFGGPVVGS
jgi:hypothetical protein